MVFKNRIRNIQAETYNSTHMLCVLWHYGLWSFQTGGTKLERFLLKNQHTQKKLLNCENWVNREVSKVPEFDFQSKFSISKIIRIFLIFFPLKNINLGAHFFVTDIF